jgi:hypothetical protein
MLFSDVVGLLLGSPPVRFAHGLAHGIRHSIGIQNRAAFYVARAAPHRLNQRSRAAQIAFFIRVENGHQRNFGQIEPLAQKVDADQHVELPAAQIAQNAHALERLDFRVQIAAAHAHFRKIFSKVLGHALGERGHQHSFVFLATHADFFQ